MAEEINKFGIVLPTIGRTSLREAIQSVVNQSYKDWNLIISYDLHDAYRKFDIACDDYRIIQVSPGHEQSSNDSGASARNYGIGFVPEDCNWVCYIDDDDLWHSNRLLKFNQFIEEHSGPLDLFYSYADLYKSKHKSPRSSETRLKRVGIINNVTCGGMCHRRELFAKTGGWNPHNTQDHDRELFEEMKKYGVYGVLEESTFDFIWR